MSMTAIDIQSNSSELTGYKLRNVLNIINDNFAGTVNYFETVPDMLSCVDEPYKLVYINSTGKMYRYVLSGSSHVVDSDTVLATKHGGNTRYVSISSGGGGSSGDLSALTQQVSDLSDEVDGQAIAISSLSGDVSSLQTAVSGLSTADIDLDTVPSGSSATTQDGLNSEFDTSIKSKAIAVTSPTGNYLLKQNSTSKQLEETLVPTTAFNIYDVPQATKTALDTNSNWLIGGVVNKTFNYIGDQGMEYINTTLGWNYKCILSGVWTRQIIGVTYVDMYDIPSAEKTKLTTAGNWTGVNYTGTLITGCYKGQRWYSSAYIYEFYADNLPIRSARV